MEQADLEYVASALQNAHQLTALLDLTDSLRQLDNPTRSRLYNQLERALAIVGRYIEPPSEG